jgi:short subunit dehydrogenase-like uncharacterized protein
MSIEREIQVFIVGASGVFGSRLARLAARERGVRLTLGGRRLRPLDSLAATLGSAVQFVDRERICASELAGFDLVIDCAGPFQGSRTSLIEQCIAAQVYRFGRRARICLLDSTLQPGRTPGWNRSHFRREFDPSTFARGA